MIYKPAKGVQHKNGKTWDPTSKASKAKYEPKEKKPLVDEKSLAKSQQWSNGREE